MSQHIFKTSKRGRTVTVLMGYDRPLDYVFCTVLDEHDEPLYSNLDDDQAGTDLQDVEYFRPVLKKLGVLVPESMYAEVASDQANSVGNRVLIHADTKRRPCLRALVEFLSRTLRGLMGF